MYDFGTIILIVAGLMFMGIYHDIQEVKREREFWEYTEKINEYRISSNKPLKVKKATQEDIEKFWNGEDIDYQDNDK